MDNEPLSSTANNETHGYPIFLETGQTTDHGVLLSSHLSDDPNQPPMLYSYYGCTYNAWQNKALFIFGGGPAEGSLDHDMYKAAGRFVMLSDALKFFNEGREEFRDEFQAANNDMDPNDVGEYIDVLETARDTATESWDQFDNDWSRLYHGLNFNQLAKTVFVFRGSRVQFLRHFLPGATRADVYSHIMPFIMANCLDHNLEEVEVTGSDLRESFELEEYHAVVLEISVPRPPPLREAYTVSTKVLMDDMFVRSSGRSQWWTEVFEAAPGGRRKRPHIVLGRTLNRWEKQIERELGSRFRMDRGSIWSANGHFPISTPPSSFLNNRTWKEHFDGKVSLFRDLEKASSKEHVIQLVKELMIMINKWMTKWEKIEQVKLTGVSALTRRHLLELRPSLWTGMVQPYPSLDRFVAEHYATEADPSRTKFQYVMEDVIRWPFYTEILRLTPCGRKHHSMYANQLLKRISCQLLYKYAPSKPQLFSLLLDLQATWFHFTYSAFHKSKFDRLCKTILNTITFMH
jgi:hypothetical protein